MSWHFSRALVAEYSRATCLDGTQSVPLKSTGTDDLSFKPAKTTEPCVPFQSGTTSEPSTDCDGEDVLTWFLEAFPARRIPPRLEAATSRTISGRRCGESWQRQLPGTYSPRTPRDARLTERPTTSSRWVITSDALPFPRRTWVRTTFGDAIGFVHTPTETANYASPSMQKWIGCREFVRVFGQPSPSNAEWLMDWPAGWTALEPLAKDKWRAWLRRHGV